MVVNDGDASEYINLKVVDLDNRLIQFKIKKDCPLEDIAYAYCEITGLDIGTLRFRYDGLEVFGNTPSSLEMEEGDEIMVFQQLVGGCFYFNYY